MNTYMCNLNKYLRYVKCSTKTRENIVLKIKINMSLPNEILFKNNY